MAIKAKGGRPGISMRAILPLPILTKKMQQAIVDDQLKMAKEIKRDFEKTTKTWSDPPKMRVAVKYPIRLFEDNARLEISVGPDPLDKASDIYHFVDAGTRPHIIRPKRPGGSLIFQWGGPGSYKAKTSPRVIGSTAGGPTGPIVAFAHVHHPGTKARKFSETIARRWGQLSKKYAPKTMRDVVEASGHEMGRK